MADIFNPLSWGQTAQNAIDTFIDLWMYGLDIITGGEPAPDIQAPMPFYEAGQGYWFSFNDGVISDTAPAIYGWSYAMVDWIMFTKDADDRIPYLELDVGGVEDSSASASWNSAVLNYWNKDIIEYHIDDAGIINSGADYIGIQFNADSADPSAIAGLKFSEPLFWYKNIFDYGVWRAFDGSSAGTFTKANIVQNNSSNVHTGNVKPCSSGILNLPRTADGYWVSIGHTQGHQTLINNYYDTIKNHNETNEYVTNNNYNSYYDTYEITLSDGTDLNVGFGPAGFGIAVGGVAGGAIGVEPTLNFDDLIDLLTPLVDGLNEDANYDVDIQLHDFDYYVSRYKDYGDFYIKPLHQYDKIPAAPAFDGTIDFGDIPKVIGSSATTYLDLLGVGVSTLLCGCFITALIIRKMGR